MEGSGAFKDSTISLLIILINCSYNGRNKGNKWNNVSNGSNRNNGNYGNVKSKISEVKNSKESINLVLRRYFVRKNKDRKYRFKNWVVLRHNLMRRSLTDLL